MSYVKSKKYRIRSDKKSEVVGLIEDNLKGSKYSSAMNRVLENKAMCWKRWMYYFDYNYLEEILEEVEDEEVEDLGI